MNMQRQPKLQWLKYSAMLLVVGVFLSILVYVLVSKDDLTAAQVDVPPLIKAQETPIKRRPDDPGGMDIPNQDRVVFDLLQQETKPEDMALVLEDVSPNIPEKIAPIVDKAVEEIPTKAQEKAIIAAESGADAIAVLLQLSEVQPVAKTPSAPVPKKITQGSFGVQLASFVQKSDADKAVSRYADKFSGILGVLSPDIQRADLGTKGVRYRVRFVGLPSKAEASKLCKNLKTQGQGCLPISQ